ncbi:putative protein-er retention protein [Phaeomoniella chlamydospora]|uniref:EXS domain-containing protein n=1 Tax=Phaeomoniella chlamydospora TaxID=158046 RepID=A0A0G2F2W9_PHACM|nr:putative protein-er retention protein [Phaeomoniella chlamydospora]
MADLDPGVEPELDRFSRILPLPYRVSIIAVLGVWAWGVNLHYLYLIKIDVPALIRYPGRTSIHHAPHHASVYRLATLLSIPLAISLLLFWAITHGSASAVVAWEILPQSYIFLLIILFILPFYQLSKSGRYRFLSTLKRVSLGGLAQPQDGKFGDILLADVLTSYAKVLGELFVSICMFFSHDASSTAKPNRSCGGAILVPLLISIPSIIRLRQCLIEFLRVRLGKQNSNGGWGGQHLANALKYSTAFPVIILSAIMRSPNHQEATGLSEKSLYHLWLFAVLVNSLYSFYWDVTKDWDLTLLTSRRSPPTRFPRPATPSRSSGSLYPYGLRPIRHFHTPNFYYIAILIDFILRFTWSIKLSPHLDHFNDIEAGVFTMEVLEVARRWMWIFFRVETEWVRTIEAEDGGFSLTGNGAAGGGPMEILLGDMTGKIDDD